jgi:CRISPR-associated protein Csh1
MIQALEGKILGAWVCGRFGKEEKKMLEAIKDLGQRILTKENKDRLSIFVENINTNGRYNTCLAIMLKENGREFQYDNVEEEPFSIEKKLKYLYRSGSGNGPDFSPTAKLTEAKKTFNMKILGWFKILNGNKLNISEEDKHFLLKVKDILEKNSEEIIKVIQEKRNQKPRKESIFLTLKFREGFEERYIGDYNIFKILLLQGVDAKDLKIYAEDKVCSICKERKPIVIGNIDTYKFYTIDKPGFISGGFKEEDAWKNFPVCLDCKMALEEGKKYIQENLLFDFAGIRYQLVPKFLFDYSAAEEVLPLLEKTKLNSLKKEQKNVYLADEEEILGYLKNERDNISLNFLFIRQIQSAERIQLLLEDVFPSRLKKLFTAKEKVDDVFKGEEQFTFWTLRTFFYKSDESKREPDLDKYFFELTEKIFKNRKIDKDFLMNFFMKKIRKDFIADGFFKSSVKRALMDVIFLNELNLIENKEGIMEEGLFDEVFEKYGVTFANSLKRGLFLLGALVELLLRKQYADREAKPPFTKNLKSLKMDEKDFKGLLPKVQNKLEEYDSFDKGKKIIAKGAADYLLLAGDKWKMSVDEMNFYFACGMNLVEEVTKVVYNNKINEEEKNE